MLKIYNSLTKQKELFKPLEKGKISFYVCGNTVYDYCHLGHARTMVAFDIIVRHLRSLNYDVNHIRNITDIDDKIIQRANENNESITSLTERMIEAQREDERALNLITPTDEPKATDNIQNIIQLIQTLIDKGHAYVGKNGDVYFEVSTFETYGKLSNKDIEGQQAGSRVDIVDDKKASLDFVLWKKSKPNEPFWASPWGEGRPGWHIECSAMSIAALGNHFDIHAGGADLQFPHHENEIAQSECATGETFANYWMHTGFLQVQKEKMSKSLGNFFTIKEVLKEWPAEVIRYFLISSHYRSQLNYSKEALSNANEGLKRLYQTLNGIETQKNVQINKDSPWLIRFNNVMNDDFNTPQALSVLFDLSREINKSSDEEKIKEHAGILKELATRLGLLSLSPEAFLKLGIKDSEEVEIADLLAQRKDARQNKDWAKADKIRDTLDAMGIDILDSKDGTSWQKR
jgi:cysteinyl-tRNA synthetase